MLRLIVNKAKHHYNLAVEHAERNRFYEAITELQNSLDLNKNNVNARILLGTIHAKQKNLDKAIAEWETALAINPGSQKAFEYIIKAKAVEKALPVLKWFKYLMAGLAASIIVVLLLSFQIFRPDPSENLLKKAVSDYNRKQYGRAIANIDLFKRKYEGSTLTPLADRLSDFIKHEIEGNKSEILENLYTKNYHQALEVSRRLADLNPDPGTLQFLKHIRDDAVFAIKKSLDQKLNKVEEGDGGLEDVEKELQFLATNYPNDPSLSLYRSRMEAIKHRDTQIEERLLERELARILRISNLTRAINSLEGFNREHPEWSRKKNVPKKIRDLKETRLLEGISDIRAAIEQKQFPAASESLREISREIQTFPLLSQEYESLKTLLENRLMEKNRREARAFMDRLEAAAEKGSWEEIQTRLSQIDNVSLSEEEKERLEQITRQTKLHLAYLSYNQILHREPLTKPDSLTEEQARQTLRDLPLLLEDLPQETYRHAKDKILFHACASHVRLGETDKAKTIFQNLSRDFPHSPYLPIAARMLSP